MAAGDLDRLLARSREHAFRFDSAAALAAAEQAARHPDSTGREVAVRIARGRALAVGHAPEALLELREALALAEQPGHPIDEQFEAGRALLVALFDAPDLSVAERAGRRLAARAARLGYPGAGTFEAVAIGCAHWGRADLSDTERLLDLLARGEIEEEAIGQSRAYAVFALGDRGDLRAVRLARSWLAEETDPWSRQILLGAASQAAFYLGRNIEAVQMATTALTAGITSGVEESLATTLAWAQYEAGLPVTPRIARNGARTTLERGARSEHAALTALATGRSAEAAARFDHAAVLLAGRAEPYALRARYGAALARIADGDAVRAQIDLLALEHLADAAGMQPLRDRIARALRTTGTRRAARRNGASAPITGREREVLALVAEGATTPEIARTLAIAETTVDTLVANVVRRLGVRSRRHAAAILAVGADDPPDLSRDELALVATLAAGASMEDAAARAGVSLRTAHRRMTALRQRLGARSTTQAVALARQISTTTGRISGRFDARR